MPKKLLLIIIVFLGSFTITKSQSVEPDSARSAVLFNFAYSYQIPDGDIAKTFGNNSTIGGGLFYKTKSNFLFSADFNYIFGKTIVGANNILSMVLNSSGYIIDGNGTYALYTMYERGYTMNLRFGKIFNVAKKSPNSGILVMGGLGYLSHRLIIDNQYHTAPQISGDYAKGYDRLTAGLAVNEFIGYFYMGKSRLLNFYGGFEFVQGFTKSQRDYVFDLQKKDEGSKLDLFYGFRIGWMIPTNKRTPDKYYYY
jgi:hypothetical protein